MSDVRREEDDESDLDFLDAVVCREIIGGLRADRWVKALESRWSPA